MRNNLILVICALLILLMSQTPKQPQKTTICKLIESDKEVQNFILKKASEGYRVVSVTSYQDGSAQISDLLIVLEK